MDEPPTEEPSGFLAPFGFLKRMLNNLGTKLGYWKKEKAAPPPPLADPPPSSAVLEEEDFEFQCMSGEDTPILTADGQGRKLISCIGIVRSLVSMGQFSF